MTRARRSLFFHGATLMLVAGLWFGGLFFRDSSPLFDLTQVLDERGYAVAETLLLLSIGSLAFLVPVVSVACFVQALLEIRKFIGFREDHRAFLRYYNRI